MQVNVFQVILLNSAWLRTFASHLADQYPPPHPPSTNPPYPTTSFSSLYSSCSPWEDGKEVTFTHKKKKACVSRQDACADNIDPQLPLKNLLCLTDFSSFGLYMQENESQVPVKMSTWTGSLPAQKLTHGLLNTTGFFQPPNLFTLAMFDVFFQWSTIKFWSKHILRWAERGSDENESSCSRNLHFLGPVAVTPLPELYFYFSNEENDNDNSSEKTMRLFVNVECAPRVALTNIRRASVTHLHAGLQTAGHCALCSPSAPLRLWLQVTSFTLRHTHTHTVGSVHWHLYTLRKELIHGEEKHTPVSVTALKVYCALLKSLMWSGGGTKRGSFHLKQEHSCFWEFSRGRNVLWPNLKVW